MHIITDKTGRVLTPITGYKNDRGVGYSNRSFERLSGSHDNRQSYSNNSDDDFHFGCRYLHHRDHHNSSETTLNY